MFHRRFDFSYGFDIEKRLINVWSMITTLRTLKISKGVKMTSVTLSIIRKRKTKFLSSELVLHIVGWRDGFFVSFLSSSFSKALPF